MRVVTLQTKDFKGLKDGVYTFSDDNIISGRNGVGKSSLAEAIVFGLYGRTISGNNSTSDLIHGNAESTIVAIEFDTGTTVVREESRFYGTTLKLNQEPIKQESLEANLPDHKAFLSIFIPGYFTNQSEGDQRKMLLGFAPAINYLAEFIDFTGKKELTEKYPIDFTDLDKAYKRFSATEKDLENLILTHRSKIEWATDQIKGLKKPKELIDVDKVEAQIKAHRAYLANEDAKKFNDGIYGQIAKIESGECITCKQRLSVDSITEQVKELKAKLVKVDQKVKKPTGDLNELLEKQQDARLVNELYKNYEETVLDLEKQKDDSATIVAKSEEELVDIRIIAKALSPKGMRAQAARRQIAPISDKLNEFSGETLPVKIETLETLKNGNIREVFKLTVNDVPFNFLSTGEKKRVSLAISQTINDFVGSTVSMYFIDDAELISGDVTLTGQVFKAYVTSDDLTIKEG